MNQVIISGFLCEPPYYQNLTNRQGEGLGYCRLVILVPRDESRMSHASRMKPTKDRPGDVVRVVVYGRGAQKIASEAKIGMKVSVSGWLETRRYRNSRGFSIPVSEINAVIVEYYRPLNGDEMPSDRAATAREYALLNPDDGSRSFEQSPQSLTPRQGGEDEWMFHEGGYVP